MFAPNLNVFQVLLPMCQGQTYMSHGKKEYQVRAFDFNVEYLFLDIFIMHI